MMLSQLMNKREADQIYRGIDENRDVILRK